VWRIQHVGSPTTLAVNIFGDSETEMKRHRTASYQAESEPPRARQSVKDLRTAVQLVTNTSLGPTTATGTQCQEPTQLSRKASVTMAELSAAIWL
jgi:hypothetical protein